MANRAEEIAAARKFGGLEIEARLELPKTIEFWARLGYVESGHNGNRMNMLKMLPITRILHTAEDTRAFGEWLATLLRHGDLVILTGDLGAGKTTLTQGIGQGLGVRGDVTSPTFVISRARHDATAGGDAPPEKGWTAERAPVDDHQSTAPLGPPGTPRSLYRPFGEPNRAQGSSWDDCFAGR